jgi:hypothetical protein
MSEKVIEVAKLDIETYEKLEKLAKKLEVTLEELVMIACFRYMEQLDIEE